MGSKMKFVRSFPVGGRKAKLFSFAGFHKKLTSQPIFKKEIKK